MKRKRKYFLILLGVVLFFTGYSLRVVHAANEEDTTCSATSLSALRSAAANLKVTYVPGVGTKNIDEDAENGSTELEYYYVDVKIYNLTSQLYVYAKTEGGGVTLSFNDVVSDGSVTIRQNAVTQNVEYTFSIYSDAYGCAGETLRTIKLTVPKFNYYSRLDICQDIPDYYLCQQYTTYDVDGSTFYDKVNAYKATLSAQDESSTDEDNNGIVSKTISTVSKHKYVVVGIVVVVGVVITIIILKKRKKVL